MMLTLRGFHRGQAVSFLVGHGGSCHAAVIGLGTLQGLTFVTLVLVNLGRLFILGVDGLVPRWLLPDRASRTRGGPARRARVLTAERLTASTALSRLHRLLHQ